MLPTLCTQRTCHATDLASKDLASNGLGALPAGRAEMYQKTMPTKPARASTRVVVMAKSQSIPAAPLARAAGLLLQNDVDIAVSSKEDRYLVARTIPCE